MAEKNCKIFAVTVVFSILFSFIFNRCLSFQAKRIRSNVHQMCDLFVVKNRYNFQFEFIRKFGKTFFFFIFVRCRKKVILVKFGHYSLPRPVDVGKQTERGQFVVFFGPNQRNTALARKLIEFIS